MLNLIDNFNITWISLNCEYFTPLMYSCTAEIIEEKTFNDILIKCDGGI